MSAVQTLAVEIAKDLKIKNFHASRRWVYRFAARAGLKWKKRTTSKQQTIHSYLIVWDSWIRCLREFCINVGIVTPRGYITSFRVWNADEFGIEPMEYHYKHLVDDGCMVNSQSLKLSISTTKRYCTVTGIVPKSGFPLEC